MEKALEIDPSYAQAYAALASIYVYMGANSFLDPKEAMPKAKEAVRKALEAQWKSCRGSYYPRRHLSN